MKKKMYMTPEAEMVKVEMWQMLAASGSGDTTSLPVEDDEHEWPEDPENPSQPANPW